MKTKNLFVLPLIAISLSTLTACLKGRKDDPNALNVICLNLGYGREWIDEAVKIWEEKNPGYKVNLDATGDARAVIAGNIAKKANDDVYISVGSDWKSYAGQGKLLAIDELLEDTVDGMKVKEKINDEYKDSIYFKNRDGESHVYRLPWTAGLGGIMYNAKMFRDHNWSVPTTVEELLTLCNKIVNDKVAIDPTDPTSGTVYPFSYTGANTDYFDYTVFSWWSQIVGVDAITTFKNYTKNDKTNFDAKNNTTYAGLKRATQAWWDIFGNEKFADPEDISRDNDTAQKNFMGGKAAMMFDGDWVYNEMLKYTSAHKLDESKFELAIMNTPKISSEVKNNGYIIGEDQYIAVPATTKKADLAKSFIKTLISDEVLNIFFNKAHGMMAYKLSSGSYTTTDKYMTSVMNYRASLEGSFTSFSSSPLYLNGFVDFWGASSGRPFLQLLQKTTKDVDEAFDKIYDNVNRQWDTWVKNSNM